MRDALREWLMRRLWPAYWRPTPRCVNALPDPVRRYIHDLETRCDPAGDLRELILTKVENRALTRLLENHTKRRVRMLWRD